MSEMKDSLIKILNAFPVWGKTLKDHWFDQAIERLADHLLANGVIVLPCKVGDVVWWTDGCTRFAHKVEVTRISYTAEYGFDMSGFTRNQNHKMFNERDIGKTVFLTKEEAEAALAERSGNG